jgi:hypothetical protein
MTRVLTVCLSEMMHLWRLLDQSMIEDLHHSRIKHLREIMLHFVQVLFEAAPDEMVKAMVEDWFERHCATIPLEVSGTHPCAIAISRETLLSPIFSRFSKILAMRPPFPC